MITYDYEISIFLALSLYLSATLLADDKKSVLQISSSFLQVTLLARVEFLTPVLQRSLLACDAVLLGV
jgi:predicted nucleic acid-binding protein